MFSHCLKYKVISLKTLISLSIVSSMGVFSLSVDINCRVRQNSFFPKCWVNFEGRKFGSEGRKFGLNFRGRKV
jgi:hypothetical protein